MSKLSEYIEENRDLYMILQKNTSINEDGEAIMTIDDGWRNETEWDEIFNRIIDINLLQYTI